MKIFSTRKGVFVKNNKSYLDIINNTLISLIPFVILSVIEYSILQVYNNASTLYQVFKPIIIFLILIISVIVLEKNNEQINKNYIILQSIIYALMININLNIMIIITIGILINILTIKLNRINTVPIGYLLMMIITNKANISYTNIIFGIVSIVIVLMSIIYLSKYAFLKWRIIIFYIITIVVGVIILYLISKKNYIVLYNIILYKYLFKVLYLSIDMPSTPVTHKGQITEGILLGILSIIGIYYNIFIKDVVIMILLINIVIILLKKLKIKV